MRSEFNEEYMKNKRELNKQVGENIRKLRKAKDISTNDMAGLLNVTVSYMRLVEVGERGTSLHRLLEICEILGCKIEALIEGHQEKVDKSSKGDLARLNAYLSSQSLTSTADVTYLISSIQNMKEYMAKTSE